MENLRNRQSGGTIVATTNDFWFTQLGRVVKEIVDDCGGAIAKTREELKKEIILTDSTFHDCPPAVFEHLTLPLPKFGLTSSNCDSIDDPVLLIHYSSEPKVVARARCKESGLMVVFSNSPALAI
jgi:hypothetical protein